MSTNDAQQQMIRDAMQAIAQRKPGKTKLVYDKTKRTIVAVAEGTQAPRALNITADDADMFAVATLASAWLRQQWPHILRDGGASCPFSAWDDGDALTQCELGPLPATTIVRGSVSLASREFASEGLGFRVLLSPIEKAGTDPAGMGADTSRRANYWRESVQDGLYGIPGNLIVPSNGVPGRYEGSRPIVEVAWKLNPHLSVHLNYIFADFDPNAYGYRPNFIRRAKFGHSEGTECECCPTVLNFACTGPD